MITGSPKFNSLAVVTLSADFSKPTVSFTARAAFIDTNNGSTHGWTDAMGSAWSKETMEALKVLKASMEQDLGRLHLDGAGSVEDKPGLNLEGGLGEHVGGNAEVDSV